MTFVISVQPFHKVIGNFRELHGNYRSAMSALTEDYRSAISALTKTADRQFPTRSAVSAYTVKDVY